MEKSQKNIKYEGKEREYNNLEHNSESRQDLCIWFGIKEEHNNKTKLEC